MKRLKTTDQRVSSLTHNGGGFLRKAKSISLMFVRSLFPGTLLSLSSSTVEGESCSNNTTFYPYGTFNTSLLWQRFLFLPGIFRVPIKTFRRAQNSSMKNPTARGWCEGEKKRKSVVWVTLTLLCTVTSSPDSLKSCVGVCATAG